MTGAIDLSPNHLEIVERILAEHVPECEVRAFGSRATWTARDYSDLDLAVVGDGPLHWRTLSRLREAFEESRLAMRVDVLDWHDISQSFQQVIQRDYVVLQEGAAVPAHGSHATTLGQVMTFANGAASPKRDSNLEHPVYGSNGAIGFSDRTNSSPNTVVIGRVGSYCGSLHYSKDACWVTDNAIRAAAVEGNDTHFLFYLLKTLDLNQWRTGSGQPLLNQSTLSSIPVNLPPLDEQCAIAHVLGTLDDKIELNRRMNETLEAMARALFRSWFVDFEPVRAKMEGRWRPGESLPGLPAHLHPLFPDLLVPSELGDIPEGWQVRGLDGIADFTNGLALQRFPPDGDEWLPVIKIAEMRRGYTEKTGKASTAIDPRYIVEDGDVLFSWSGSLELVLWSHGPGALNQHLFKVTSDQFPRWFYWGWLHEHLDDFRGIAAGKATTMGHIQRHHLTDAKVAVPPAEILMAVDGALGNLIEQQVAHAVQNRDLARLRDTLLPRLVSGVLRVGAAVEYKD